MKAMIGLLALAAALRPDPAWAAPAFDTDSGAILAAARAEAASVPAVQAGNAVGPNLRLPEGMVPPDLMDNIKKTLRNITGDAFSDAELDLLAKMVVRTISVSPFATVSLADVMKLGSVDPNARPIVLTGAQARVVDNIFKSIGKDRLTPVEQDLYRRAQAEWAKARSSGTVVVKG
ncbi:MAG: hypothetical protein HY926_14195 [Elusimicrobia bacterium]|nr:hypothetical protein [Elusimicrobiota bacterium]